MFAFVFAQMFTYFTECMKLIIENAKKEGRYSEGMLDITASSVEMVGPPREILTHFNKGHTSTRWALNTLLAS